MMAETLVLGSGEQSHVVIEELEQPVILFKTRSGLAVRHAGSVMINGQAHPDGGLVEPGVQVQTDAVSFALENVR